MLASREWNLANCAGISRVCAATLAADALYFFWTSPEGDGRVCPACGGRAACPRRLASPNAIWIRAITTWRSARCGQVS